MKKQRKKGQLADFGEMMLASIVIIVLAIIVLVLITAYKDDKENEYKKSELFQETAYTTRILLQTEIEPGKKLYEEIINLVNQNNYEDSFTSVKKAIDKHFTDPNEKWIIIINDKSTRINTDLYPVTVQRGLPKLEIPNPNGNNIKITIRNIQKTDFDVEKLLEIDYQEKKYQRDATTIRSQR
ncbi:hypothetical protein K9L67_03705 [Candidatus Woesearchaeota archaeon]|nr:hypothetical protein [Candidatus Woesearchaeota archaeon]MCF7901307.1 hypothetical protein [Candidatus Woesearchaeota archaeon]MCF8013787.1 hypothetical protein [Candidatus Woesearchaeota archaeon]